MRDPQLKAFSDKVKKGFVDALGDKSSFSARKLNYGDFCQMARADLMCGAAPDEYPSDQRVREHAKYCYLQYLQGKSVDEIF